MKRPLALLLAFLTAAASAEEPAALGRLNAMSQADVSGDAAQVRANADARWDGEGVSVPAYDPLPAPEPIKLQPRPDETSARWGGDPRSKPEGFKDSDDEDKPDKKPTFLEKAGKFIGGADLPGWILKAGVAVALYGVVTFNVPVLLAGVGMAFASLVLHAFIGSGGGGESAGGGSSGGSGGGSSGSSSGRGFKYPSLRGGGGSSSVSRISSVHFE